MPRNRILSIGGGSVFASGGVTNNVIPKSNGAGALADSSITDNATTVQTVLPLNLTQAASTTNAIVQFNGVATTGLMFGASSYVGLKVDATSWIGTSNNGVGSVLSLPSTGCMGWSSTTTFGGNINDTMLGRRGTANIRLGLADSNGVPVAQTISVQNAITGSDLAGSTFTIDAPLGTGLGAGAKIVLNRAIMKATGGTAQTAQNAFAVGQTKTLSNTSATAQTIATITLGSNAGGGCSGTFTIVATDGTNFDSETQSFNVSFVNKATVVTVGTPAITASTAAVNSGTTSLGITAVANGNNIDIKVTPVFGTIVPTTVTLYPVISHSTNTVTFS